MLGEEQVNTSEQGSDVSSDIQPAKEGRLSRALRRLGSSNAELEAEEQAD